MEKFSVSLEDVLYRLSWKNRLLAILYVIAGGAALIALPLIGSWVVTLSGWDWWGATLAVIYVLFVVLALAGRAIIRLWRDSRKHRRKLKGLVDEPVEIVGLSMMMLGFIVAVFGVWYLHLQGGGAPEGIFADLVSDFYANLSVDFISVGIAILIINRLYDRSSKLEEKQRIIKQLRSPSKGFAQEALRIVTENDWLRDGSLKGADLSYANLSGADLSSADLSGADLSFADLSGAKLWCAKLSDARLHNANLSEADLNEANLNEADLQFAFLNEACLRNAFLNEAWLRSANLSGADLIGAELYGAIYDDNTEWPEGFYPLHARHVDEEE